MNRCFKIVIGDYLTAIGVDDWSGKTITEEEYNTILHIIENKPADTETHYYKLRADTLEYEMIERDEPIILPEPTYTLDEAATILAQEVSQNGYDA